MIPERIDKTMKKTISVIAASLILLTSCSQPTVQDYFNTQDGCLLGSTYYKNFAGLDIQLWNPAWDNLMEGLCRDPLCTHNNTDSLCPSSTNLQLKTAVTDGERLYLNALNFLLTDEKVKTFNRKSFRKLLAKRRHALRRCIARRQNDNELSVFFKMA